MRASLLGASLLASLLLLCMGCASTMMQTSEQLESGQVVLSGALDMPGYFIVPRASGQALIGVGGFSDVGVHAGTTVFTALAGGSARLYLAEWLMLGVQGDFAAEFEWAGGISYVTNGTARLTTRVEEDGGRSLFGTRTSRKGRIIYGGLDVGYTRIEDGDHNMHYIAVGFFQGAERPLSDKMNVQFEVSLYPVAWEQGEDGSFQLVKRGGYFGAGSPRALQVGVGINYSSHRKAPKPVGPTLYPADP
jgi:hypothetical protein